MNWYFLVFKKYAKLSGRSRRKEYWMFILFNTIISIILSLLDKLFGFDIFSSTNNINNSGILSTIYSLATLVPFIAVGVRRLHDTNRSGWFLLLPLAPYLLILLSPFLGKIGFVLIFMSGLTIVVFLIVVIVLLATKGDHGKNYYGSDPKESEGQQFDDSLLDN